ncbi:MAG TPA: hypothetical protein VMS53_06450 [Burkholderiales bacterium]|nr:hypothetical protein [Burkholderiales bacterium]
MTAHEDTIYQKTDKGKREIADRALGLEGHARRLLVMIDGQRDSVELSVYVRAGELESTLALLVAEGFVEAAGQAGSPVRAPAANDPVVFAGIKIRAMAELRTKLGPTAERLVSELNNCPSPLALRAKLRSLENLLVHLMGRVEGVSFARRVGAELTQLIPQTPAE